MRTNNFPESGRGLGHVTATIFCSTVGYPSDSLASCDLAYVKFVNASLHSFLLCNFYFKDTGLLLCAFGRASVKIMILPSNESLVTQMIKIFLINF